jgi:CRP/FNR family transcriptional regulator, anaerobic regulatory protein
MNERLEQILTKSNLEPALIQEIILQGRMKKVKVNDTVISPASTVLEMPFVLSGMLKVMRQDDKGNEAFLYFLEDGETCAMSITCCLEGAKQTDFIVRAEEDASLWMVPMTHLDEWIVKYPSFRKFVFQSYQMRFDELLTTIDSVIFTKMDERIYKYLLDKKQASGSYIIEKTHEQIARELNSSRVVISRLLKQLEKEGKIEQFRNRIEIL